MRGYSLHPKFTREASAALCFAGQQMFRSYICFLPALAATDAQPALAVRSRHYSQNVEPSELCANRDLFRPHPMKFTLEASATFGIAAEQVLRSHCCLLAAVAPANT